MRSPSPILSLSCPLPFFSRCHQSFSISLYYSLFLPYHRLCSCFHSLFIHCRSCYQSHLSFTFISACLWIYCHGHLGSVALSAQGGIRPCTSLLFQHYARTQSVQIRVDILGSLYMTIRNAYSSRTISEAHCIVEQQIQKLGDKTTLVL